MNQRDLKAKLFDMIWDIAGTPIDTVNNKKQAKLYVEQYVDQLLLLMEEHCASLRQAKRSHGHDIKSRKSSASGEK